jgi:ubiquinone/menaquinone biosynthesis C-methylase UbiE
MTAGRHPSAEEQERRVVGYYRSLESRLSYRIILNGIRHFGYFPDPAAPRGVSMRRAQFLMVDELARSLRLPPGSRVLDAGCGEGSASIHLALHYGYRMYGIDLVGQSIHRARRLARAAGVEDQVYFEIGNFSDLRFQDGYFDGVFTLETLVHAADVGQVLGEFRRVLRPGGRLVMIEYSVSDPNSLSEQEREVGYRVVEQSAMASLPGLLHGRLAALAREQGFAEVEERNVTAHVMPMLKRLRDILLLPYLATRLIGADHRFPNMTSAVVGWRRLRARDVWRYNIVSAALPPAGLHEEAGRGRMR